MKDYFGIDASDLSAKKLFLFDMDGTIYNEETVFDGVHELLDYIDEIGGYYMFITNNSSKSVNDYIERIKRMGIRSNKENFFTSTQATALYLQEQYPGAKVYCQGTRSFVRELTEAGIRITEELEKDVDVVLVGFDTEVTGQKLRNTCQILTERDLPYIAANPDLRCPVSFGYIPDCGSMCDAIRIATGKYPIFIGKPEPTMINIARKKFGYTAEETLVIGDRLYTDIASGLNAGVTAVCVLSGEATIADITEGEIKPTYTFLSVKELYEGLAAKR